MPKNIKDSVKIEGLALETMPPHLCMVAALVKRLGGEVLLTDNEVNYTNFKGVLLQLSKHGSIVIKVE